MNDKNKKEKYYFDSYESRTHDLTVFSTTPCQLGKRTRDGCNIYTKWINVLMNSKTKKKNNTLVRMSLELMTLALLAPRSANWANGPRVFVTFVPNG